MEFLVKVHNLDNNELTKKIICKQKYRDTLVRLNVAIRRREKEVRVINFGVSLGFFFVFSQMLKLELLGLVYQRVSIEKNQFLISDLLVKQKH